MRFSAASQSRAAVLEVVQVLPAGEGHGLERGSRIKLGVEHGRQIGSGADHFLLMIET